MKKNVSKWMAALLVAVCTLTVLPAQAQLKFGVKGGLNITSLSLSKDIVNSDNRTGFFIGPMAEFTLPIVGLGVDAAVLYSQSRAQMNNGNDAIADNLKSLEVPINLKWTFGLGSLASGFIAAGPQFGWNVGNSTFNVGNSTFYEEVIQLKNNFTTFNVGVGAKFLRHFQAGVNYNFSLGKVGEVLDDEELLKIKRKTWQISVAYLF